MQIIHMKSLKIMEVLSYVFCGTGLQLGKFLTNLALKIVLVLPQKKSASNLLLASSDFGTWNHVFSWPFLHNSGVIFSYDSLPHLRFLSVPWSAPVPEQCRVHLGVLCKGT